MEKIAYFDCFSGASGDMILGALVDAGLDINELGAALAGLAIAGEFSLRAEKVNRGALSATLVHVDTEAQQAHQEHPHPHESPSHQERTQVGEPHHSQESHSDGKHRHLPEIIGLIQASGLSASVQQKSLAIFRRLAEAEGSVHGVPAEQVHFHEVGAVDAIVDIVGAVWGLERLGITQVYASPIPLGESTKGRRSIESSHGTLPLPAPATLALLASAGAPTYPLPTEKELVTPTGAAILASLATFKQPAMRLEKIGVGAGGRALPWPNVLRLWLGKPVDPEMSPRTSLSVLETNLDNMNPELIGHTMALLFEAGALDVYLTPIHMKKNRPGTLLSVIARPADEAALAALLLRETSTLGVRVHHSQRYEVEREVRLVETPYGLLQVKVKWLDGRIVGVTPEYEACRIAARQHNAPLAEVYRAAEQAAAGMIGVRGAPAGEDTGHG